MNKKFDDFIQAHGQARVPWRPRVTDPQGKYNVDGLRWRYTCALRQRIACGLVRSNFKTYSAWLQIGWPIEHAEVLAY